MDIWLNLVIVYMAFAVFSWVKNGFYYLVIVLGILSAGLYSICENKALALFAATIITNFIGGIFVIYKLWTVSKSTPGGMAALDETTVEKIIKG
jgi:hypothetical protein